MLAVLAAVLRDELLWGDAVLSSTLRDMPPSRLGVPGVVSYSEWFRGGLATFGGYLTFKDVMSGS